MLLLFAFMFALAGLVCFIVDLILPTHFIATILGVVMILMAIANCFGHSIKAGVLATILSLLATPFVTVALLKLWPRTPVANKLILPDVPSEQATSPAPVSPLLKPGDTGTTLTSLRPTGICTFANQRVEALSDRGILPPNTLVVIVTMDNSRPVVRVRES